jgi:hypothetical protein
MILRKPLAYQNVSVYGCRKAFGARIRALSRSSLMRVSWSAQTKPRDGSLRSNRMESG